ASGLDEMLGSPSVTGGRVYFQTRYATYCLGKAGAATKDVIPATGVEGGEGEKPGKALMIPGEITLAPGESVKFDLARFTTFGRASADAIPEPEWTLAGAVGVWDPKSRTFTAGQDAKFSAGVLKAKIGDGEATARIRVSPKLPIKVDFEDLKPDATPPGWQNVISKTKIIEQDGGKVLQKLAERPSPPFMRIRAYMTPPIAGGYTITADMMSNSRKTPIKEFWADMGVINSRYELRIMGNEPKATYVRLVAWDSIPRVQKDVPFAWQPGAWYRAKFEVRYDGGKALLRGKVWPRDAKEPDAWLIEETDPYPNLEGSPGLYAYSNGTTEKSKGAEVFFDNVTVTDNAK
ncbi:MAG: hypothetical protein ACKVS9_19220, partial [Phycisphaerae bacterium]